jgi:hypothetical protein
MLCNVYINLWCLSFHLKLRLFKFLIHGIYIFYITYILKLYTFFREEEKEEKKSDYCFVLFCLPERKK